MTFLYLWGLVVCGTAAVRGLYMLMFTRRLRDIVLDPYYGKYWGVLAALQFFTTAFLYGAWLCARQLIQEIG